MDLLRKFRYNFNYWLKNCLQATPGTLQPGLNVEAGVPHYSFGEHTM